MSPAREKRGQFIIIAVLLTAIMLVSIGALMHSAVTYYKHEPWEEYSTLIGDIELNSRRLVELSLADYTNNAMVDSGILSTNLQKWQDNLTEIYPNSGIVLTCLSNSMSGSDDYSSPTATTKFGLDIRAIGLEGYTFSTLTYLSLTINVIPGTSTTYGEITATLESDSSSAISGLRGNFRINDKPATSVRLYSGSGNIRVYKIPYNGSLPVTVKVWDQRGILAVAP